jgi:hypothetical protein
MTEPRIVRAVFANELRPGDVVLEKCFSDRGCGTQATSHHKGVDHELTLLRVRDNDVTISAVADDEDGEQQPFSRNKNTVVRILARDTRPAETPADEVRS